MFLTYFILVYLVLVISISYPVLVHDCRLLELSVLSYFYVAQSPLIYKGGNGGNFFSEIISPHKK